MFALRPEVFLHLLHHFPDGQMVRAALSHSPQPMQSPAFMAMALYRPLAQSARPYRDRYPSIRNTLGMEIPTLQGAQ